MSMFATGILPGVRTSCAVFARTWTWAVEVNSGVRIHTHASAAPTTSTVGMMTDHFRRRRTAKNSLRPIGCGFVFRIGHAE